MSAEASTGGCASSVPEESDRVCKLFSLMLPPLMDGVVDPEEEVVSVMMNRI
jgi:hypothetical protein